MYECKCSKYSHMILIYSIKMQNRGKCYFKKISIQGHRAKQQVWSRGRKNQEQSQPSAFTMSTLGKSKARDRANDLRLASMNASQWASGYWERYLVV